MVQCRSSAVPHSLLVVDSFCGHYSPRRCRHQMEQSWRMWWTICSVSLQSQCAKSMMPGCFECAHRLASCSQPEYSGLLMSCQMVGWVCIGLVVSSCSSSLASVSEQDFGFLVNVSGQGLQLFAPRFGQAICSVISWNPTVGWDPLKDHGAFLWEKLQVFQQLVDWLVRGIGDNGLKGCFAVYEIDSLL